MTSNPNSSESKKVPAASAESRPDGSGVGSDRKEDQLLVDRVKRGERGAFDLLVTKYQIRLNHLVGRFVKDPGEAEDIVQESFVRAYRAIETFRGDSAFYTWIYRIAVNTAKNHLVAMGRRPPISDVETDVAEFTDASDRFRDINTPEGCYRSQELTKAIQNAMSALPKELERALVLRELEGMSYEEIANEMACPVGTVRSRIFRAREAVERAISEIM